MHKGQKSSGELTASKGAWLVREGAVGNVPQGNAPAAYFTFSVRIAPTGHFDSQKGPPFTWSSSDARCACGQETLALQHKTERMDKSMAAQENVALARSLLEQYNSRQSEPAWLEKSMAAFAADAEVIDVPSGTTLRGPDGYKRLVLFFTEAFPDSRVEPINAFATEDQVVLEFTSRGTNIVLLHLPSQAIPATGRSSGLRLSPVMQLSNLNIVTFPACSPILPMLKHPV